MNGHIRLQTLVLIKRKSVDLDSADLMATFHSTWANYIKEYRNTDILNRFISSHPAFHSEVTQA